jgi:hypothetical protein
MLQVLDKAEFWLSKGWIRLEIAVVRMVAILALCRPIMHH